MSTASLFIFAFEDERKGSVGIVLRGAEIVECEGELCPIIQMSREEALACMEGLLEAMTRAETL